MDRYNTKFLGLGSLNQVFNCLWKKIAALTLCFFVKYEHVSQIVVTVDSNRQTFAAFI